MDLLLSRRAWLSSVSPFWSGLGAFVLCWVLLLSYSHAKFGLNIPPSTSGDEPSYDSLGWELSQGRGFQIDTTDHELRAGYDLAAQTHDRFQLPGEDLGPITFRPPLFPVCISFTNILFGHQYWAIRLLNTFCLSVVSGLLVSSIHRKLGLMTAMINLLLFVIVDERVRLYGRAILTEAMSVLAIALLTLVLMRWSEKQRFRQSILSGVLCGLAVLTRSMFVLWLPGLFLFIGYLSWKQVRNIQSALVACLLFTGVTSILLAPWVVRNCNLLGELMPLGTQGLSQLSAGFGDAVWENNGRWPNLVTDGFFDDVLSPEMPHLEREVAMAKFSKAQAKEWIVHNPGRAIALVPMKILQELKPQTIPQAVILFLAMIGAWGYRNDADAKLCLVLLAINFVAIALTWSVEGRFLVPLLFPIYLLAGMGVHLLYKVKEKAFDHVGKESA